MSIYLLIAIGYKGGYEIYHTGINSQAIVIMIICMLFSFFMPIVLYHVLNKVIKMNKNDSVIIAASFSSVSAVTFITAMNILILEKISYDGYMVIALTLMECPAIISGMIIYGYYKEKNSKNSVSVGHIIKTSVMDYSVVLLIGSLIIGYMCGDTGYHDMAPLTSSLFKGFLTIFLLGMGIEAAQQVAHLKKAGIPIIIFSILVPIIFSLFGILLCFVMGLSIGNTLLVSILFGSASYIAVPAALSEGIPDSNVGLMTGLSLIITFTFNICIGIPVYLWIIKMLF